MDLLSLLDLKYVACVSLATFGVLHSIIHNPSKFIKIATLFILGIIAGYIWFKFINIPLDTIITSFVVSAVLHTWVIKELMKVTGITYDNDKGVKL